MNDSQPFDIRGALIFPGLLDREAQARLVEQIRAVVAAAPFFRPVTPAGRPLSVRMTSAGSHGWVSDRSGYRYERRHPEGMEWPPIPSLALEVWERAVANARAPECCLVNWYDAEARMGLHQDRDEVDFTQPVVSISLGDDARFRVGNLSRGGKTESIVLRSGDVVVLGGGARLVHHGVDRIYPGTGTLLGKPGRINLTLRVVT
ncbi:alpha-ketoglutarate-dependent dioxygenase AlkB family protein [Jannaschia aquimarina]|uniref:AlkB protein n=1 Tax=Jannaschia aquimarina TaxID=935700 RepID=A0A0D1CK24_9RHOB|nr:alpha-ketoglutarate-dependent dioxygenase AlkB [Jannaschia aquimarina]KIT15097.1 Alpha-ketoglutarate-dependent dioxygenase AlkB [Jannaschia aquimarina]SNS64001.1 alkylated DNA repair protein (DNA oxidative demethylase) [Jannaschia aquimarina]